MAFSSEGLALVFKIIGKGGDAAAAEMRKPGQAAEQTRVALGKAGNVTVGDFGAKNARAAAASYRELGSQLSEIAPGLGRLAGVGGAAAGIGALAVGYTAAAKAGITYQETLERLKKSFESLLGSEQAAARHLQDLKDFAARTPFEFEDVARASQKFLNMKVAVGDVIPLLTAVGNAVAKVGGGATQVEAVSRAIGQVMARQRVSAEEMNQLADALVDGWGPLEKHLGRTRGELMKMAEQGQISSTDFVAAFRAAHESGDAMQKQMETLTGATSTLKDATNELLAYAFRPYHALLRDITVELARMTTEGWNWEKTLKAMASATRDLMNTGNSEWFDKWLMWQAGMAGGPAGILGMGTLLGKGKGPAAPTAAPSAPDTTGADATRVITATDTTVMLGLAKHWLEKDAAERVKASAERMRTAATEAEAAFKKTVEAAQKSYEITGDLVAFITALKKAEEERWDARQRQFKEERAEFGRQGLSPELLQAELEGVKARETSEREAFNRRMTELDAEMSEKLLDGLRQRHARELELFDLRARQFIERQKALAQAEIITYAEAQRRIAAEQALGFNKRKELLEKELEAAKGNAEREAELRHQLAVLQEQVAIFMQERSAATSAAVGSDLDRMIEKVDALLERFDRLREYGAVPGMPTPGLVPPPPPGTVQPSGPTVDSTGLGPPPPGQWVTFGQVVTDVAGKIGDAVGVSGQVVMGVFNGITSAVSQTVQAFGGLAGVVKNLGEFTKAVVRNIAVMAGINAIWEAAQGVAALALAFFWPSMALKATKHFQAAALYGIVAGTAGAISAGIGGPSGGAVAGAAYGGSPGAGGAGSPLEGQREDFRTRYMREQEERNRYTSTENRRGGDLVVQVDGRTLMRIGLDAIRDGGDLQTGFQRALGVPG